MAYGDYLYRRENGIFYFRYECQSTVSRFSLRTRNYLEAKRKSAIHFTRLVTEMGDYMEKDRDIFWELPDSEKIKFVKENYADQLDGTEDGRFLIDMFDIFTKTRDKAQKQKIMKMAEKYYDCQTIERPIQTHSPSPKIPTRLLSEAIEIFIQQAEGKKADKTIINIKSKLPFILELLGDKNINDYHTEDFLQAESKLRQFPKTGRSDPIFKGKSIDDIIRLNTEDVMLSDVTIYGYLITINTIFNQFPTEYRKQFGIKAGTPLVAKEYSEQKRQVAIDKGLGEKLAAGRAARAKKKK